MAIRIIGIDPGSRHTGWGVVEENSGVLALVACGVIHSSSNGEENFSSRLARIHEDLCHKLETHKPAQAAIEQVFTAKNAVSALKLGQARGVAVAACAAFGLEIFDYEPTLIKKSLVGAGRAEKDQVAFMVARLLNANLEKQGLDATDALAAAICHLNQRRFQLLAGSHKI